MTTLDTRETLVTPTGVLVYDGPVHSDGWYGARRGGITATDAVKILGLSKYGTAVDVWADKRGVATDDGMSEAAEWGLIHEPAIDARWCQLHGTTTSEVGVLANVRHLHHRASLDRLVTRCPDGDGPCGLQIKTRSAFKAGEWSSEVPDDVYVQEQWEMHVTGFRHMHVAVLIGGNQMSSYRVDVDPDDQAVIVARADEVWEAVAADRPPAVLSPDVAVIDSLNRLYRQRDGAAVLERAQAEALVADWLDRKRVETEANRAARAATTARKEAEVAMVAALGPSEAAFVGDECAYVYKAVNRAGYTVEPTTYRQIKIAPGFEVTR